MTEPPATPTLPEIIDSCEEVTERCLTSEDPQLQGAARLVDALLWNHRRRPYRAARMWFEALQGELEALEDKRWEAAPGRLERLEAAVSRIEARLEEGQKP